MKCSCGLNAMKIKHSRLVIVSRVINIVPCTQTSVEKEKIDMVLTALHIATDSRDMDLG